VCGHVRDVLWVSDTGTCLMREVSVCSRGFELGFEGEQWYTVNG